MRKKRHWSKSTMEVCNIATNAGQADTEGKKDDEYISWEVKQDNRMQVRHAWTKQVIETGAETHERWKSAQRRGGSNKLKTKTHYPNWNDAAGRQTALLIIMCSGCCGQKGNNCEKWTFSRTNTQPRKRWTKSIYSGVRLRPESFFACWEASSGQSTVETPQDATGSVFEWKTNYNEERKEPLNAVLVKQQRCHFRNLSLLVSMKSNYIDSFQPRGCAGLEAKSHISPWLCLQELNFQAAAQTKRVVHPLIGQSAVWSVAAAAFQSTKLPRLLMAPPLVCEWRRGGHS